jgi:hypothetical protein
LFKRRKLGQVKWLATVIPATQKAEIRRITVQGQPRQKVTKTPYQPIKAGHGGTCLSSQLHRKQDCGQGQSRHKARPYMKK